MRYPDAYSNILRTLNPHVKFTLDDHYGIDLEPKTQTGLDMLRENLVLVQKDIKEATPDANYLIACAQKMSEALP